MARIRTYLDACVLITAFTGTQLASSRAHAILGDPNRDFLVSDYLIMEVLPKPTRNHIQDEIDFMQSYLDAANRIESGLPVTNTAVDLAIRYGLHTIDSLHVSCAIHGGVDEIVTFERGNRPYGRVTEVRVLQLSLT